jgi:hypothetical protein
MPEEPGCAPQLIWQNAALRRSADLGQRRMP